MSAADLKKLKACADMAPAGTYEDAKALNEVIGDAVDNLMRELRALGLKADNCDRAFELEAAIYAYVKASNPGGTIFTTAEGFGDAMSGPARERVIAQAARDRDFLAGLRT